MNKSAITNNGKMGLPMSIKEMSKQKWDTIIIGAGHNGLTCAAYLAKNGKKVLVLEAREQVGGACKMLEPFPGYRVSPCAYVAGLMHGKVIEELKMKDYGYEWVAADGMFVPFDDGTSIHIHDDEEKSVAEIKKFSSKDVKGWSEMHNLIIRATDALRPDDDNDVFIGEPPTREEVEKRLKGDRDAIGLVFDWSMIDYVEKYLEDERLQQAYIGQGIIGANYSPYEAGTASIYFYHFCGRMGKNIGEWGFVKGGMGTISFILCDIAKDYGATIACGTPVSRIIPGKGVMLEGDDMIYASNIVSNADPQVTLKLLQNEVDAEWKNQVESIPIEGSTVKINIALSELPNFTSRPGLLQPHHYAVFDTPLLSKKDWQESFDKAKAGDISDILWTENYFQSVHDGTSQPEGKHTMSVFCQYAPYKFAQGTWDDHRERVAQTVIGSISRFCSNMPQAVIEYEVLGPPDIEREIGLTGGHIFHGEIMPEFMWDKRLKVKTPMKDLYLCGAATHPGGGVIAINGRNAAMKILEQS